MDPNATARLRSSLTGTLVLPATRRTTRPDPSGTRRSTGGPRSSSGARAPTTSGARSSSRSATTSASLCAAVATASPARRRATAAS
jgi:hypothetical protein